MTFSEARTAHLKEFDDAVAKIREVISDQLWCNPMHPKYKQSWEQATEACGSLMRLNSAQLAAERAYKP